MVEGTRSDTLARPLAGRLALGREQLERLALGALIVFLFLALPKLLSSVWLNNVNQMLIAVVGVTGVALLLGFTGQISIGHGAFAGIGGFAVAVMNNRWHVPILVGVPIGGVLAALLGVVVGVPSLRVRGLYLAVATLASQEILSWFFEHMKWLTKARTSSVDVRRAWIFNHRIKSDADIYHLFFIIALLGLVICANLMRTRLGRAFVAIRDREIAAEIIGVNAFAYKLLAFAISAFYAGIAGGMTAILFSSGQITPSMFDINLSISWLAMAIIGGLGSIPGAVFGAVFLTWLPIELRTWVGDLKDVWPVLAKRYVQIQDILFGVVIIGFLIFEPDGLYAIWRRIRRAFERFVLRQRPAA